MFRHIHGRQQHVVEKFLGARYASNEGVYADLLNMLWPETTIVAGGSSFMMFFIRDSMSPMRLLSTKCDSAPQSDIMVNFSGPGIAEPAKNENPMPDGGDSMTYGVGAAWEVTGVGGGKTGAGGAATRVDRGVTRAAGTEAITVDEDVPLAVTAVLARPVLEPSLRRRLLPLPLLLLPRL